MDIILFLMGMMTLIGYLEEKHFFENSFLKFEGSWKESYFFSVDKYSTLECSTFG